MQRGGGGMSGGGMQRGGGGMSGGGMQRGGGGMSGGGMQRSGGFGGGLSSRSPEGGFQGGTGGFQGGMQAGGAMGSFGVGGSGGAGRPGMGAGGAGRPGMGSGGVGAPGVGAGGAGRPGLGAGGVGAPGLGTGGVGGPDSGIGARPGLGAGRPGLGAGGVGGPDSGIGARPGLGAGAAGVPGGFGTYHTPENVMFAQRNTVVAGASAYPAFTPAMYAGYAGAWMPSNLAANSLYANPGYGALASTIGMAAQPVPYDYGGNVVAQPDAVYVNGDPAGSPQDYAAQAGQIASTGAAEPAEDSQWQPIGVFAMVEAGQSQPNDLFQLAVNGQGIIRGNYHNVQTNETDPLAGAVDPQTQRAAWTIGGDTTPVYEAGIANLTGDQATMLVHTPDGQQRQFTLVRLPDPGPDGPGASPAAAPQP
jgi:hypothetical protein